MWFYKVMSSTNWHNYKYQYFIQTLFFHSWRTLISGHPLIIRIQSKAKKKQNKKNPETIFETLGGLIFYEDMMRRVDS